MPIATRCPRCKAKLKGPDNLVGRTLKCPGCGTPVLITKEELVAPAAPSQGAAKPAGTLSVAKTAAQPAAPNKQTKLTTTNPTKSPIYDDLEVIYDDLEVIEDETAESASAQTAKAPPVRPPESAPSKDQPAPQAAAPKPPAKKPATDGTERRSDASPVPNPSPVPDKPAAPAKLQTPNQGQPAPIKTPKPTKAPAKQVSHAEQAPPVRKAIPPKTPEPAPVFPNLDLDKVDVPAPAAKLDEPLFPNFDLDKVDVPSKPATAPPPRFPNMELDKPDASSPQSPRAKPVAPIDASSFDGPDDKPFFPDLDLAKGASPLMNDDVEIRLEGNGEDIKLQDEVSDEEEVFDDFEVIEEKEEVVEIAEAAADEEEIMEVEPVEEADAIPELALAADDEVDDLEEVHEDPGAASPFSFTLLKPSVIFVQGQSGMFSVNNAYDLLNGRSKKRLGEALEKKDDAATVLRLFVGNNFVPTRVEVREGRHRDLVLTIRRPPHLWTSKAEIYDNDDQLLGSFEIQPFSTLMAKPVWISDHNDKKIAKMKAAWMQGKCVYSTPDDKKLAETMSQAVYEQRIVLKWAPRGGSFYITFTKLAEKKPRHKLLLLGVVLGIDLFYTQNQRGPIIGGGRRF